MNTIYLPNTHFISIFSILFTTLQLMACSTGDPSETSTQSVVDAYKNPNQPAIISGVDRGSVTEDIDVDADNMLNTGGALCLEKRNLSCQNHAFDATSIDGAYGSLTISADGIWSYSADNNQTAIQSLESGTSLSDSLTVSTVDDTQHTVVITINGTDEVIAPVVTDPVVTDPVVTDPVVTDPVVTDPVVTDPVVTDPVVTDPVVTDPVVTDPVVTDPVINISLGWTAPSEREDNTPVSLSAIGGYNIYYGSVQGDYINTVNINDGTADSYTFNDLPGGTYYFVITTYDTEGRESLYSPVIVKTI